MNKLTVLLLLVAQISFAQSNIVDETINKIEFKQDTIKSVFDWIANNIKYDVDKLNETKKVSNSKFKNEEAYKKYLLEKVIKRKKGVCEDYALLFDAIIKKLGYESYIVSGYTKTDKGKINRSIGHAWNAVKVNETWRLYDATWAAGYVKDEKKFVKRYNPKWYDVDSKLMIKNHMPFDPIWQISITPMTYEEFETNNEATTKGEDYDFDSIIQQYLNKEKKEQMQDQVKRSIEMGEGIRLIEKWRRRMTKNIGLYGITSQQDLLEDARESSTKAVELFNEYIKAKNKQFKGKKWAIENASQKLERAKEEIQATLKIYNSIEVEDQKAINALKKSIRHSDKLMNQINKELEFVEHL